MFKTSFDIEDEYLQINEDMNVIAEIMKEDTEMSRCSIHQMYALMLLKNIGESLIKLTRLAHED